MRSSSISSAYGSRRLRTISSARRARSTQPGPPYDISPVAFQPWSTPTSTLSVSGRAVPRAPLIRTRSSPRSSISTSLKSAVTSGVR